MMYATERYFFQSSFLLTKFAVPHQGNHDQISGAHYLIQYSSRVTNMAYMSKLNSGLRLSDNTGVTEEIAGLRSRGFVSDMDLVEALVAEIDALPNSQESHENTEELPKVSAVSLSLLIWE